MCGCGRRDGAGGKAASAVASKPTAACLIPAITDLIISMDAGDHLVGVSKQGSMVAGTEDLPRVGDYLTFDWEKLATIRPDILIVQIAPGKVPPGLRQRADQLHIQLLNIHNDRIGDIFTNITRLGHALNEQKKAQLLAARIYGQLDAVRRAVAGRPPVPTLIATSASAEHVVGRRTFLNDLLSIAGGENVVQTDGYVSIDQEKLVSLQPQAVLQLLQGASSQQTDEARRVWRSLGQVPATHGGIHILTQWYVLLPGAHVGELAEAFARSLHPDMKIVEENGDKAAGHASSHPSTRGFTQGLP